MILLYYFQYYIYKQHYVLLHGYIFTQNIKWPGKLYVKFMTAKT